VFDSNGKQILATMAAADFVGRANELERLARRAGDAERGLLFLSAPTLGASELLKQIYDRLFREADETIPVYFAVRKSDKTARRAALRFAQTFLEQTNDSLRRAAKIKNETAIFEPTNEIAADLRNEIERRGAAFKRTGNRAHQF
jgi:hypothetical protein